MSGKIRYNRFIRSPSSKSTFVIICLMIIAIIIDTSIPSIALFTGGVGSSNMDVGIFTILVLVYTFGQITILGFIKRKSESVKSSVLKITQKFVSIIQLCLIVLLFIIILQMVLTTSYDILFLKAVVWVNCATSIILLGLLIRKLLSW